MRIFRRFISLFIAVLICISSFSIVNVSAAEITGKLTRVKYLDGYYFKFSESNNYRANGHHGQPSIWKIGNKYAYCIELGVSTLDGMLNASKDYKNLDKDGVRFLKYAMIYGYNGTTKYGKSADVEYYATQIICWAISEGRLFSDSQYKKLVDESLNKCPNESDVRYVCSKIKAQIKNHKTYPSFSSETIADAKNKKLNLHWKNNKYTASITDKKGVLQDYQIKMRVNNNGTWSSPKDVADASVTRSGNKLTVTISKGNIDKWKGNKRALIFTRVKGAYISASNYDNAKAYFVTDGKNTGKSGGQDMIFSGTTDADPVKSYILLDANNLGSLRITKKSTDNYGGHNAVWRGQSTEVGIWFNVKGDNYNKNFATDENGEIVINNLPYGNYTITELWDGAGHYYNWQPQTVTVNASTPDVEVTAVNWEKWRQLNIQKVTPDGNNLDGWIFRISGVDDICAISHDFEGVTNDIGEIVICTTGYDEKVASTGVNETIRPGTYEIEEVGRYVNGVRKSMTELAEEGWCTPPKQTTKVEYGKVAWCTFKNEKTTALHLLKKTDAERDSVGIHYFHLTGTASDNTNYDEAIRTNYDGLFDMTFTEDGHTVNGKKTYKPGTYKFVEKFIEDGGKYENADYYGYDFDTYFTTSADATLTTPKNEIEVTITENDIDNNRVQQVYCINKFKPNKLNIIKTSNDDVLKGFEFKITLTKCDYIKELYNTDNNGNKIPKYQYFGTTDENGEIVIDGKNANTVLPPGTYEIEEINTPLRYIQPEKQTVVLENGTTKKVRFYNTVKYGHIRIDKIDAETHQKITSDKLKFDVYMWSEEEHDYIEAWQLRPNKQTGKYDKMPFTVVSDTSLFDTYNYILRTVEDENHSSTPNIMITDDNLGKFKLIESYAPDGYVLSTKEYDITLDYVNKNTTLSVENTPQKAKLALWKVATGQNKTTEDGSNVKSYNSLAGAEFSIYAKEDIIVNGDIKYHAGDKVDTVTTVSGDWAYSNIDLYLGKYEVIETKAPKGFVLDKTPREINLEYQGQDVAVFTEYLTIEDEPQMAKINIYKESEVLSSFTQNDNGINDPVYEKQKRNQAEFEIYAKDDVIINEELKYKQGDLVDTVTTTKNGKGTSKPLYIAEYEVVETKAPSGCVRSDKKFDVKLEYQGQEKDIFDFDMPVIDNARQKVEVDLTKTIVQNEHYPNKNAFKDVKFGVFSAEDIKNYKNEIVLKKDSLVDIFGIDENGKGKSTADLPAGKYYVKETKTADGWILPDKAYYFEFKPDNDLKDTVIINLNEQYGQIINEPIKVRVNVTKRASDSNKLLSNAVYGIYRKSDDRLIEKLETDENGKAQSSLLPYGEYYVQELVAPPRYKLDDNKYDFTASQLKEFINFDLKDVAIVGKIKLSYKENGGGEDINYNYPKSPVTSDLTKNIALAIGLAIVSGVTVVISGGKRKKNGGVEK